MRNGPLVAPRIALVTTTRPRERTDVVTRAGGPAGRVQQFYQIVCPAGFRLWRSASRRGLWRNGGVASRPAVRTLSPARREAEPPPCGKHAELAYQERFNENTAATRCARTLRAVLALPACRAASSASTFTIQGSRPRVARRVRRRSMRKGEYRSQDSRLAARGSRLAVHG